MSQPHQSRYQVRRDIQAVFGERDVEYEGGFSLTHLIGLKLDGQIYVQPEIDSGLDAPILVEFATTILSANLVCVCDSDHMQPELSIEISPLFLSASVFESYHEVERITYKCCTFDSLSNLDEYGDNCPKDWKTLPAIWVHGITHDSDGEYDVTLSARIIRSFPR